MAQSADVLGQAKFSLPGDSRSASALALPAISITHFHDVDHAARPSLAAHHLSAPAAQHQHYHSPIRHHRRTPSQHREVKETLNAHSEYTSNNPDGRSHHRINQYVIKEEIGRGSFGAVHRATDQFGNEFAIKEFSKARLRKRGMSNMLRHGPRRMRARFGSPDTPNKCISLQEAQESKDALFLIREEIAIMKQLNHPNLVQLIEVLDDPEEDSLYMVLETCKKGVIMQVGLDEPADPYPEESCRCWFRDLILGIEYLHAQGVVHRDIKPDNLLLTGDDVLKVVDFGVSEMFEKRSDMKTARSAGSPAFLPPELCVARHGDSVLGKAADIWSMGVSLYCLKYGSLPFEKATVPDMYEAITTETPSFAANEDAQFVDLMQRLMEKIPEKRIVMSELREHPWVTKGGQDPLLSAQENCADEILTPSPLDVNRALTQKFSNVLSVMKAISKFKNILTSNKDANISTTKAPGTAAHEEDKEHEVVFKSVAEHAAQLIRERKAFLQNLGHPLRGSTHSRVPGTKGHAHDPTDAPPPLLGIGVGGVNDFTSHGADASLVVSDSPIAVDFNVYDQAFDAEVERIKRTPSRKGRGSRGERATSTGRTGTSTLYHTRHLGRKDKYQGSDEHFAWMGDLPALVGETSRWLRQ